MNKATRDLRALGLTRLGDVVHVGAGEGRDLQAYRELGAKHVRLVEPHPELATALRSTTAPDGNVEVVQVAASDEAGERTLHLLNNASESSLLRPAALLKRLPNLRLRGEVSVPTAPLTDLISGVTHVDGQSNLLVIEVNGMESRLLRSVSPNALEMFDFLLVRSSPDPMYEGAQPVDELAGHLEELGFERAGAFGPAYATSQLHGFRINRERTAIRRLETELAARDSHIQHLEEQTRDRLRELDERLQASVKEREAQIVEVKAALADMTAQRQRLAQSEGGLRKKTQELEIARASLEKDVADLRKVGQDAEVRRGALEGQLAQQQKAAGDLKRQLEEERNKGANLAREQALVVKNYHEQIEELEARRAKLEQDLGEARKRAQDAEGTCSAQGTRFAQASTDLKRELDAERNRGAELAREQAEAVKSYQGQIETLKSRGIALEKALSQARDAQLKAAADGDAKTAQLSEEIKIKSRVLAEAQARATKLEAERNDKAKLAESQKQEAQRLTTLGAEQARAIQDRDAEIRRVSALHEVAQERIAQLTASASEQQRLAAGWQGQLDQLRLDRDEAVKLATSRLAELEQQAQQLNEQSRLAGERKQAVEQLTKTNEDNTKRLAEKRAELDRLHKQIREQAEEVAKSQALVKERDWRQTHLNQEVLKAEAQIDLIKDVLLREPGL